MAHTEHCKKRMKWGDGECECGDSTSTSDDLLCTLPWHIGFSNEIADNLEEGKHQHHLVRYEVHNVCANNGRHIAWAASKETAELIVNAVNKLGA